MTKVYKLTPLVPLTGGIASGLLPTMRASLTGYITPERCADKFNNLESVLARQMWPTLRANSSTESVAACKARSAKNGINLEAAVNMWPTPNASDHKGAGTDAPVSGGSLNPAWVSAMMGYPPDWTEVD